MLTLIKVMVVMAWLVMVLLLVFAPTGSRGGGEAVIFHVSDWGSEVEREFLHTLKTLPPKSQLMLVDDGTDALRSQVIERLIVRHPGVIAVKPQADYFSNGFI
jgi:hypothetical protein